MTQEEKLKKYSSALDRAAKLRVQNPFDTVGQMVEYIFPELKESEDESKNWILEYLYDGLRRCDEQFKDQFKAAIAWLEKQEPVDKDKLAKGALRSVANTIMQYLDANTAEGKMCLSNMECEDIENAVLNVDWAKVYRYMKKKLEK